jgi:hypothetical protein
MRGEVTLAKIEKEIGRLKPEDQLRLVKKLTNRLKKTRLATKQELDWTQLYGLGKGLWKGEDAQKYVNRLREDRG